MIRRFVLVAIVGGATAFALPAAPAQATAYCQTNESCTYTYYSFASRTVVNGYLSISCSGQETAWGVLSGFEVTTTTFC